MPRPTVEQAAHFELARHAIVRAVRGDADITSVELAERVGVSYDFVVRFRRALRRDAAVGNASPASKTADALQKSDSYEAEPEPKGPIMPALEHDKNMRASDELLAALRLHHPRGHDNWLEGREALFRGIRPTIASGMGCGAALCVGSA